MWSAPPGRRRAALEYTLGRWPDVDAPIDVRVNGALVPSTSSTGTTVWIWDDASRSVSFSPDQEPAAHAQIAITYTPSCTP